MALHIRNDCDSSKLNEHASKTYWLLTLVEAEVRNGTLLDGSRTRVLHITASSCLRSARGSHDQLAHLRSVLPQVKRLENRGMHGKSEFFVLGMHRKAEQARAHLHSSSALRLYDVAHFGLPQGRRTAPRTP